MDNGRMQNIREFPVENPAMAEQEVRRMAGVAMAAGAENQSFGVVPEQQEQNAARERVRELGWQVIEGGAGSEALSTERALETAALEVSEDENRLEHPEAFAGDEAPVQIEEDLERQRENALNEMNPERDRESRIAAGSQERIAYDTMHEVGSIMDERVVSPNEIVKVRQRMGAKMLASFEVPYKGDT